MQYGRPKLSFNASNAANSNQSRPHSQDETKDCRRSNHGTLKELEQLKQTKGNTYALMDHCSCQEKRT
jgi:hypothetical protein